MAQQQPDNTPNQTSDRKYYSSANRSVIRRDSPDRKGRPGEPLQSHGTPAHVPGDSSTDKYYRDGGSRAQRLAAVPPPLVPVDDVDSRARPQAGRRYTGDGLERDLVRPLIVTDPSTTNVRLAVGQIVTALLAGTAPVRVQVATPEIESAIRLGLDIQVAQERITRDQYRDVQFALAPADNRELADRAFGKIDPDKVPVAKVAEDEDDRMPTDFASFVRAGDDAEDGEAPAADETSNAVSVSAVAADGDEEPEAPAAEPTAPAAEADDSDTDDE